MNLGRRGEDEAAAWLEAHGHTILERNWRNAHLEVDIISLDRRGVHFVEVKTRKPPFEALPQDCVGPAKQRNLANAARAYMRGGFRRNFGEAEIFFDVIGLIYNGESFEITYIPEAFIPLYV